MLLLHTAILSSSCGHPYHSGRTQPSAPCSTGRRGFANYEDAAACSQYSGKTFLRVSILGAPRCVREVCCSAAAAVGVVTCDSDRRASSNKPQLEDRGNTNVCSRYFLFSQRTEEGARCISSVIHSEKYMAYKQYHTS